MDWTGNSSEEAKLDAATLVYLGSTWARSVLQSEIYRREDAPEVDNFKFMKIYELIEKILFLVRMPEAVGIGLSVPPVAAAPLGFGGGATVIDGEVDEEEAHVRPVGTKRTKCLKQAKTLEWMELEEFQGR